MDSLLPERQARTYNAIQIRNDMFEGLIDNIGDPLKVSKIIAGTLKDKFLVRSDDDNYGRSVIDPLEFDDWVVDNDISINTPAEIKEAEKQFRKYIRDNRKFVSG